MTQTIYTYIGLATKGESFLWRFLKKFLTLVERMCGLTKKQLSVLCEVPTSEVVEKEEVFWCDGEVLNDLD